MKKLLLISSILCISAFFEDAAARSVSQLADDTVSAVKQGKPYLKFRYRYEFNDDDAARKNANASTLRSVIGYETAPIFEGLKGLLEIENVKTIASNEMFNDGNNGKTRYPLVPDPEITEINQLYLSYEDPYLFSAKLGRQILKFDNERFIGENGWRQNQQTMDAVQFSTDRFAGIDATYAYVANVNLAPGDRLPDGDWESSSHLLNISYDKLALGKITGYAYFMDFDNSIANSNQTIGASFDGNYPFSQSLAALYRFEYATQQDYGDNRNDYDAGYYQAMGGVKLGATTLQSSYEVLESEGTAGKAFRTPLATTHRFQGWADKFTTTPAQGIEDLNASASYKLTSSSEILNNLSFTARYHMFTAQNTGTDYGTEIDLLAEKQFSDKYYAQIKGADFDAEPGVGLSDTKKIWLTMGANF